MSKSLNFAEQVFTVIYLLLYTGGPLTVILLGGASEGDGAPTDVDSSFIQVLFFLNYIVTFFLLVARWKKVLIVLRKDRFIWLIVGIAVISVLWSFAPAKTLRRGMALVGTTLFGLYLASRYSMKQQLQLLGWMFGSAVILSLIFIVALPKYGLMGGVHAGAWRGIYPHKNSLGQFMVLSSIIFFLLALDTKRNRWLMWCGFSLSILLLLRSSSTTSLLNLVSLIVMFFVLRTLRLRYDLMIPIVIAIVTTTGILTEWFTANAATLLGSIGKDPSLTGRTDMWPFILEMVEKQPWLGYGYNGFWLGLEGEGSAYVWRASGWTPPNAHNGFLDIRLDLGLLGLLIYLTGFFTSFLRGLVWVRQSKTSENLWPMIYFIYTLLGNFTESTILGANSIIWVIYVAVALSVLNPPQQQDFMHKIV